MDTTLKALRILIIPFWGLVLLAPFSALLAEYQSLLFQLGALVLVAHLIEIPLFFGRFKNSPGGWLQATVLTLVFGMFHLLRYPARKV